MLVPSFGLAMRHLEQGFDEPDNVPLTYAAMFLLTILTVNTNGLD